MKVTQQERRRRRLPSYSKEEGAAQRAGRGRRLSDPDPPAQRRVCAANLRNPGSEHAQTA